MTPEARQALGECGNSAAALTVPFVNGNQSRRSLFTPSEGEGLRRRGLGFNALSELPPRAMISPSNVHAAILQHWR